MRRFFQRLTSVSLFLGLMVMPALGQSAVGTDFTYQGKLRRAGAAVNGTADFQFRLFDAPTDGSLIGSAQNVTNVSIADGLFTTRLDFGPAAFNGDARYLEIAARSPAGSGSFVVLTPRQPLTAAPYALKVRGIDGHSLDAADGSPADAVYVDNTGNVGIGTVTPVRKFSVSDSNLFTARFENDNPLAAAVEYRSASSGATWEFGVAGSTPPFGLPAGSMYIYQQGDPLPALDINPAGYVGIGTTHPISPLDVRSQWGPVVMSSCTNGFAIVAETAGSGATALSVSASSPTGQTVGVFATSGGDIGSAVRALATSSTGVNYGVYASSASSSGYDFYAAGAGVNYGAASSRRWKHNLEPIGEPLAKLARIRGVYFDWDAQHGGHHDVGMIAEEVGAVLPEIVAFEANGIDASGMDYSKLTPLLVEVAKAQQSQMEELRQANAELCKQVATQRQELAEMRERVASLLKRAAEGEQRSR